MMLVIAMTLAGTAKASPTTIAVEPAQLEVDVGKSYIINITVTDVSHLYLWVFRLRWNNSVVQLNSIVEGSFLKQGGTTALLYTPLTIAEINAAGRITEASCTLLMPVPGVSGSGVLATLNFTALAIGTTTIEFWEDPPSFEGKTILIDDTAASNPIPHTEVPGSVDVIPEFQASVFTALFLLAALLVVVLEKTVWSTSRKNHIGVK